MLYPIQNEGVISNSFLDYWNMLMYKGAELMGMSYIEFNLLVECVVKPAIILVLLFIVYINYRKIKYGSYIRKAR